MKMSERELREQWREINEKYVDIADRLFVCVNEDHSKRVLEKKRQQKQERELSKLLDEYQKIWKKRCELEAQIKKLEHKSVNK